jgi:two-component system, cell cycle sensor histidine kinase and response regulator CckA
MNHVKDLLILILNGWILGGAWTLILIYGLFWNWHHSIKPETLIGEINESAPILSYIYQIKFPPKYLSSSRGTYLFYPIIFIWLLTLRSVVIWKTGKAELKHAEKENLGIEQKLPYSEKLECLEGFAGGIAHVFNNILTAIIGNLELALLEISSGSVAKHRIENAINSSLQAADLTRQILNYSGKGLFIIRDININEIIHENLNSSTSSLPDNITIDVDLADDLPFISADPSQIRQILMNLFTNASEAIGDKKGKITIVSGLIEYDINYFKHSYIRETSVAGQYVFLEVSDTGCGMDENAKKRLFDPFFTTKCTGRGLGLAAVFGFIKNHQGAVFVESDLINGTGIRIMFPVKST